MLAAMIKMRKNKLKNLLFLLLLGLNLFAAQDVVDVKKLEVECEKNNAQSCTKLGFYYAKDSTAKFSEALVFLQKGCELKMGIACFRIGNLYLEGKGVQKDVSKALKLYNEACDLNNSDGCYNLAVFYQNATNVERDIKKAKNLYQKASDLQNGLACSNLAFIYNKESDNKTAEQLYIKSCELKDSYGCFGAANLLASKEDYQGAGKFYLSGCELNDPRCCFNLGVLNLQNKISPSKNGLELVTKSCELNFAPACNLLGLIYKFGEGAQKDESKAQSYLKKACELGDKNSCEGKPSGY